MNMQINTLNEAIVAIEALTKRLQREGGTLSHAQRLRFLACKDRVAEIIESIDSASASEPSVKAKLGRVPERLERLGLLLDGIERDSTARQQRAPTMPWPITASRTLPVIHKRPKLSPIIACWCGSRSNHD
jgi:hypothetical protein